MKKSLFFALLWMLSTLALAQTDERAGTPQERAARQAQRLAKELDLSAEQQAEAEAALLVRAQTAEEVKGTGKANKRAAMGKIKAAQNEYEQTMRDVLTDEQYAKFTEMQEEQKTKLREKIRERRGQRDQG
jgi:periplasmic protein CpxP/Spy